MTDPPSSPTEIPALDIHVWSDIACPWCYVGKRRLEAALERFSHRGGVQVTWRAFELDPSAPREHEPSMSYVERLAAKYRTSPEQAAGMIEHMTRVAAEDGIDMRFDRIRAGNTFDAHRLLHLARERGLQGALKERLLAAYFGEGAPIGDPEELTRLAGEVGLDADEARATLASEAYAEEVRRDEAQAAALGIRGVPFFVLAGRLGVSGAQPVEVLERALRQAWQEASLELGHGAVCGPDGC